MPGDGGRTRITCSLFLLAGALLWLVSATLADNPVQPHVAKLTVDGAIGPATTDYLQRAMTEAGAKGARLIVIRMDTPGGLDAATRDIIKTILASSIPVAVYVHPSGARAASAGTYILYASHISAMTPSTTLGAATPVQMGGPNPVAPTPDAQKAPREGDAKDSNNDEQKPLPGTAMERKVINDAVAFIRGLAQRYGRNADWAEQAVREAVSLTAEEALAEKVVDVVAVDMEDLLAQIDGREVQMERHKEVLNVAGLPMQSYDPDWRNELLALITNPQVAYILLLVGIYGLILEGYSPGAMVPGVVGIISLLLALYALQVLPVNYAGLALIVLGALLIMAEAFLPSFGILGMGGVVALVMGSVMLIDSDVPGMEVSRELIAAIGLTSSLLLLGVLIFVGRNWRTGAVRSNQAMVGLVALVREPFTGEGQVHVAGERWRAVSEQPLAAGQRVRIVAQQGLVLQIQPISDDEEQAHV